VSAHFYIRRTGELWQFVSCDDRAWHAGQSSYRGRSNCNDDSIGIELEGLEGDRFEAAQYNTLTNLCAALMQHYPVAYFAGHEHIAPGRKADPGPGFDWAVFQAGLGLDERCLPLRQALHSGPSSVG
jgi:AmpD protein